MVRVEVLLDLRHLVHKACTLIRRLQGRQFLFVGRALGRTFVSRWIGQVLELGRVVSLVIEEAFAFKEVLPTLESRGLLHLLEIILVLVLLRRLWPLEILILVLK